MPGFTVERRLGVGSSGEVWRGVDHATGEPVALKRLPPGRGNPVEDGSRLRREAAVLAAHEAGLVHGELSLGNILLTSSGVPLLADLGAARLIGEGRPPVRAAPGYVDPAVQRVGRRARGGARSGA